MQDLTDKVTVFVITVGGPTFEACMKAVRSQDVQARIEVIRNVAPMSAAFQAMIDRCETPYYIQVDEDMILRPKAVRKMFQSIRGRERHALVAHPLWDVHLRRVIMGVKIYNHSIMRNYPYRDVQSCECDQMERLRADKFIIHTEWHGEWDEHKGKLPQDSPGIMGDHGTYYSSQGAFERYYDLVLKYRRIRQADWVAPWPRWFIERYREEGDETDLWAFLGSMMGLAADETVDPGEKDFRKYAVMAEFARMKSHNVPMPIHLDAYVSSTCNLKCNFCARQRGGLIEQKNHMNVGIMERILSTFPTIKSICIAGFGEPLCNPDLGAIASMLIERPLFVSLITNGTKIVDVPQLPYERFEYVNVSINEANAEAYEQRTGTSFFDKAMTGFRALKERGANVGMSFVIDKGNINNVPDYMKFAAAEGARFVSIVNVLPHHSRKAGFEDGENVAFIQRAITRQNTPGFDKRMVKWTALAKELNLNVNAWPVPLDLDHHPRLCRSAFYSIGVDGDGGVSGCNRVMAPRLMQGSIWDGDEVWYNHYFTDLRAMLAGDGDLKWPCTCCFATWKHEHH